MSELSHTSTNFIHVRVERESIGCRYHPSGRIHSDSETGDVVCKECGLVVGDRLVENRAEWRNFDSEPGKDRSRVGAAEDPMVDDGSLFTLIGPPTGTAGYNNKGVSKYLKHSTQSPAHKALQAAFREIMDACMRLHLPKVVADAARGLFKDVVEKSVATGSHRDARIMACVYIACRAEKHNRTFKEVCATSGIPQAARKIGKAVKEIISVTNAPEDVAGQEVTFMERLHGQLRMPGDILRAATYMIRKTTDDDEISDSLPGKDVGSVCGAVIMLVAAARNLATCTPLETIINVVGKSRNAVVTSYKALREHGAELFPKDFQFIVPLKDLPTSAEYFQG